jgi:hypothetical protein
MKKSTKLTLNRETLHQLGNDQLTGALGGSADTVFQCNPTYLSVTCSTTPQHKPLQGP